MELEIATVRNSLVSMFQRDPEVITKIGGVNVDYGVVRAFPAVTPAIRIVTASPCRSDERELDYGVGEATRAVEYNFYAGCLWAWTDAKDAEDKLSEYDKMIRRVLRENMDMNGVIASIKIGKTFTTFIPEKKQCYAVVEVTAEAFEVT